MPQNPHPQNYINFFIPSYTSTTSYRQQIKKIAGKQKKRTEYSNYTQQIQIQAQLWESKGKIFTEATL